jgi:sulfatase maturation enzyme AslB (radical SAM superfamily)
MANRDDTQPVHSLGVLLTSGCNLACRYCYRHGDSPSQPTWDDLRATLDWVLAAPGGELEVIFSGGEPLLEFDLLSRAVDHLENRHRGGRPVKVRLLTTGLLLDEPRLDYLVRHSVHINLSFDGLPEAQDQRASGSWEKLDGLLVSMRRNHPEWFSSRFLVTMTLTPQSLPHLADSVDYLTGRHVPTIGISPALSSVPGWNDDLMEDLDRQMDRIFRTAKGVFEKTGQVPFLPFRKNAEIDLPAGEKNRTCVALGASTPVLDVDGRLYSCLMFAPSGLDSGDRRLMEIAEDLHLGRAGEPGLEERRKGFSAGIRHREVFTSGPQLESIYRKCNECQAAAFCRICPLSLLEFGAGTNPGVVPALLCSYYFLLWKYLKKFPVQEIQASPQVTPETIRARMRHWDAVHEKIPGS